MKLWIPGPLPGMNEIVEAAKGYGGKGLGYSKLKRAWTETVAWRAKAAGLHRTPMACVHLDCHWIEAKNKNGATRDPDNIEAGVKFCLDGLKVAGVIPDDKMANIASIHHTHAMGPLAGVEVTVTPA